MTKSLKILLAAATLTAPVAATAQFGGLGRLVGQGQGSGESSVTADQADAFLSRGMASTKNVMTAAAALAFAVESKGDIAATKARMAAINGCQDVKELNAHMKPLQQDLAAIAQNTQDVQAYETGLKSKTTQQRAYLAAGLANLTVGIARNAQLAKEAPAMVKGIGGNPQLLNRLGQFRTLASLISGQGQGLGSIASSMPRLLSIAQVKAPNAASKTALRDYPL